MELPPVKFVNDNLAVFKKHPYILITSIIGSAALAFTAALWIDSRRIDEFQQEAKFMKEKNDELRQDITEDKEKIKLLSTKLEEKDKVADDMRKAEIQKIPVEKLRVKALQMSAALHELLNRYKERCEALETIARPVPPPAVGTVAYIEAQNEVMRAQQKALEDCMSDYEWVYKQKSEILRDELRARVINYHPDPSSIEILDTMYDHPTNPIGLEMVANDLKNLTEFLK